MLLKEIVVLNEKRSWGEANPKISAYQVIKQYKDNPNIFITFSNVEKLGLYPLAEDGGTPLGIYAFPLKETWKKYQVDHYGGFELFPEIAHNKEHILILEHVGKTGKFINGLLHYSEADFQKDLKKLEHMYHRELTFIDEKEYMGFDKPFAKMYNLTRLLSHGSPAHWNHILRHLGYSGFNDKEGTSMIHYAEPYQTVFFTKSPVKLLGSVYYRNYDDAEHLKEIDPRKMTTEQMYKMVRDNDRRIQKFEPYIAKDPMVAAKYAWKYLKKEWPKAEPAIMTSPEASVVYAKQVLKRRWPKMEPLMKKAKNWESYKEEFGLE